MTISYSSLLGGGQWHTGSGTIRWSMPASAPSYYPTYDANSDSVVDSYIISSYNGSVDEIVAINANTSLNLSQQAAARMAIKVWNDVATVNIVEGTVNGVVGDIFFAGYSSYSASGSDDFNPLLPGGSAQPVTSLYGFAHFPGTPGTPGDAGDIWINNNNSNNAAPSWGSDGWDTFVHELGHALGLLHPDNQGNNPDYDKRWSVMSYRNFSAWGAIYPLTPMLFDIQAIQSLYGANYSTRNGNTTYFGPGDNAGYALANGGSMVMTIWDGGGIDTIDASNQTGAVTIDLNPGAFSSIGVLANNIAIANLNNGDLRALIENATGGSGNDTLVGNVGNNVLRGGGGVDRMSGGDGNDTLYFDPQDSLIDGGAGIDTAIATSNAGLGIRLDAWGVEVLYAGAGNDSIFTFGTMNYSVDAGGGNDSIAGNVGNDMLGGNAGNDLIYGDAGNDTLGGGAGADRLMGGVGADSLFGEGDPDAYIYRGIGDAGDTISGFESYVQRGANNDHLEFWRSGFLQASEANLGALDPNRFVRGQATLATGQFLFDTNNGRLYWDGDGTGAGAPVWLLTAQFVNTLSARDIFLT